MSFDLLPVTLNELWAIHDFVRQHDKLGQEWDRDFNSRVMAALQDASAKPDEMVSLMCLEEELWQIDRQVPSNLMVGTQPVGRHLLVKVMGLLLKMRGDEDDAADDANTGTDSSEVTPGSTYTAPPPR